MAYLEGLNFHVLLPVIIEEFITQIFWQLEVGRNSKSKFHIHDRKYIMHDQLLRPTSLTLLENHTYK